MVCEKELFDATEQGNLEDLNPQLDWVTISYGCSSRAGTIKIRAANGLVGVNGSVGFHGGPELAKRAIICLNATQPGGLIGYFRSIKVELTSNTPPGL